MKVIASLCDEDANQREDKDGTMILSRGSRASNMLVSIVSIAHLVIQRLIGITH